MSQVPGRCGAVILITNVALELSAPYHHSKYVSTEKHFLWGLLCNFLTSICLKFGGEVEENMILKNSNKKTFQFL